MRLDTSTREVEDEFELHRDIMRKPIGPGPIQGKLWGTTQPLFDYNGVEIHKAEPMAGGYTSEHYHDYKWNRFIVLSGKVKVTIFDEDPRDDNAEIEDETMLEANMASDVPPRKWHMFEALEDSVMLECYWVELDPRDIVRRSIGGVRGEPG